MEKEGLQILVQLIVLLLSSIFGGINPNTTETGLPDGYYDVVDVVDGDTIKIELNGEKVGIRLIGIDTPELHDPRKEVECFALQASNVMEDKVGGMEVYLESDSTQADKDKYDRYLRYIELDEENVNKWLIENGYAYEYTYNVPYKYQEEFEKAENFARNNAVGLWNINTCGGER